MNYINNNGINVYYRTAGDPLKPALVMLHGFGNDSQNWFELGYVDILKEHSYLMMPYVRGYGKSDKPTDPELLDYKHIASSLLYQTSITPMPIGLVSKWPLLF